MMPFGTPPKDDRKNVIKQMKVRTTIKGDKSWIHKPDETEGQTIELPPSGEHSSTAPPLISTRKDRPQATKPPTGYIIRGVFTKPVDSTPLPQTHFPATSGEPKRPTVTSKPGTACLPRLSPSGYKISADDYSKKLAETSNNLLQRSATWERSYVLSAAKKSSVSSAQDLKPPFMAKRVEVIEDEVSPERSQTLPSLSKQLFSITSSDSSRERAGCSAWTGTMPRSFFSSPRVQECRTLLDFKERNIAGTRLDREEDKDPYADIDRSSTWSTDSNHGSTGSQNDLDEVEVSSKKGFSDLHSQESLIREMPLVPPVPRECRIPYWNFTRLGSEECDAFSQDDQYDRSMNLQYCMSSASTAKYASATTITTTEKRYGSLVSSDDTILSEPRRFTSSSVSSNEQRYGTLPSMDDMMASEHRSSLSGYEERSVTTIVREARWDSMGLSGAKGSTRSDPAMHYSDYRVISPDSTLKSSSQEPISRRCVSASGERTMSTMIASSRDSASASDCEQSSHTANKGMLFVKDYMNVRELSSARSSSRFSKISGFTCTYCDKEIRSGPKITLEHLGICCHEYCFKCGVCKRKMGNMLDHVYIHKGIIHCDQCYARLF